MTGTRSALLAAWGCAWLSGHASSDELLRAVRGDDRPHVVTGLPEDGTGSRRPLLDVLLAWRRSGQAPRVVLPVPGDVRGLPGPAPFVAAGLSAGEAVVAGSLGLVPEVVTTPGPTSAASSVVWRAWTVAGANPDHTPVRQAQHELTDAVREAASTLAALGVAGGPDVRDALDRARRAGERLDLPTGFPSAAIAVIAQAERLSAVLDLAGRDHTGGAVDLPGIDARARTLRAAGELATAVRRARQAGYNALWTPVEPAADSHPDGVRVPRGDAVN